MKKILLIFAVTLFSFYSCQKAEDITDDSNKPLTDAQIADGLKEALRIGTDTAVVIVSQTDGYFADLLIKIYLPPESTQLIDSAQVLGIEQDVQDLILMINRSAEDAAPEATAIFDTSITNMTIIGATNILHGEDTAATHFFRDNAYYELYQAYKPKIEISLNKDLGFGMSAQDKWTALTNSYNNTYPANPVGTNLSTYVTEKALDGLFEKIKDEEKQIRTDPTARVNDILKEVFGELD